MCADTSFAASWARIGVHLPLFARLFGFLGADGNFWNRSVMIPSVLQY